MRRPPRSAGKKCVPGPHPSTRTIYVSALFDHLVCAGEERWGSSARAPWRSAQTIRAVLLANATATAFAGLRASKMTAPPRRRRCNALTSSRDGVFSAPASPRASPRVFCVAALVSPRLSPRPRSQAIRRALLPQLLPRSRRGTSASFEACCHPLPCILSSMGSRRKLKVLPPESEGQVGFTPTPLPNRC